MCFGKQCRKWIFPQQVPRKIRSTEPRAVSLSEDEGYARYIGQGLITVVSILGAPVGWAKPADPFVRWTMPLSAGFLLGWNKPGVDNTVKRMPPRRRFSRQWGQLGKAVEQPEGRPHTRFSQASAPCLFASTGTSWVWFEPLGSIETLQWEGRSLCGT